MSFESCTQLTPQTPKPTFRICEKTLRTGRKELSAGYMYIKTPIAGTQNKLPAQKPTETLFPAPSGSLPASCCKEKPRVYRAEHEEAITGASPALGFKNKGNMAKFIASNRISPARQKPGSRLTSNSTKTTLPKQPNFACNYIALRLLSSKESHCNEFPSPLCKQFLLPSETRLAERVF